MIKNFLQKIFGNYLSNKAELYEGTPTEGKAWYKSKAILAAIYIFIRGSYDTVSAIMSLAGKPPLPQFPTMVDGLVGTFLGVMITQGRLNASKPIVVDEDQEPTEQRPA